MQASQSPRWRKLKHSLGRRRRPPVSKRSRFALDAVNFFLAELTGIGSPYLGDLLRNAGWGYGPIGIAASMSGIGVCLLQPIAGFHLDRTRRPRIVLAGASVAVGACYALLPSLVHGVQFAVYATLFVSGLAQALFGPLLAGLALGLVGPKHLQRTVGANQAFNHLGDVMAALAALLIIRGGVASVFYLVGAIAVLAGVSALVIRRGEIDPDRASGGTDRPMRFSALLRDRAVLVLLVSTMLFHTAYASAFPFLTLRVRQAGGSNAMVAVMVLVSQGFMAPVAILTGPLLEAWGRKPVFGFGFVALFVFLLVCVFVHGPLALVGMQALGSIGPGILGVALVAVCADLARGTGRFHALTAATRTAMSVGAVLGTFGAGFLVGRLGYELAFAVLAAVALAAAALFILRMPETRRAEDEAAEND